MSVPSVATPYSEFIKLSARHTQIVSGLPTIDPKLQRLLAELVLMRLFDEFQGALSGIALRLACGAKYADGSTPKLLTGPAKSTLGAKDLFENYGRPKARAPKWSRVKFINETTEFVFDPKETFLTACSASSLEISEMQAIRNRIAHNNSASRKGFSTIVKRHYGANVNTVTPGLLLLSSRFEPTLIEHYIAGCRIILKSCIGL